ncbi:MAG: 4-hydroxy-tetrahydrodipicolinate synthase [Bryobacterales bacterium]|nr:4-hydroxy-tetrahydrodipicolinate synthase [Acidobacteriota bacterium]MCB9384707.1 4-hydroxy-tetrahydrodipicolinate synthase [Bryobacterales bacterium]
MTFKGCGTAMVTPFQADGSLDEATLRKLVRRQIEAGIHFLVPCGTTGESPTLSRAEHLRVVEITVEECAGKIPVLAGCGGYNTAELVELAQQLEKIGADGLLSVTPYYNKPTSEGLYQHYLAIANATKLPIVVYSVASRTARNVTPDELVRLAEIPNVIAVKEASGSIGQMAQVCQRMPADFAVLSGDDAVTLPLISLGGVGVISVVSNQIPAEMAELCNLALAGDFAGALAVHRKFHPLMEVNFCETSPGPVKYAMAKMGLCEEVYRLPMVPVAAASRAKVDAVLGGAGLL